jgi:adenylate cyclase
MEFERKFLLRDKYLPILPTEYTYIRQAYIPTSQGFCVRVRLMGTHLAVLQNAEMTVKRGVSAITRYEINVPLDLAKAQELYALVPDKLEKMRYRVPFKGHTWEIDLFQNRHQGLVLAELELSTENEIFELPPWVGREVTDDPQYLNETLSRQQGRWHP